MNYPVVTIREGKVRGKIAIDINGDKFYSFQGIPYAKPPLGLLRFKAPQPPEKWKEIRDATKDGDECYSKSNTHHVSEDCLILNVFTKKIQDKELKPVMFFIHGGGFFKGSSHSSVCGPEFLITQDIVLVTFNYRLGILGFLSFKDSTLGVPGNAGFKDMVMALKWIQNNIKEFSGDPHNVTIFGESSGAATVNLLMLSPMAKGLFHKGIAHSGSALNGWVESKRDTVYMLANILGIKSDDDSMILQTLQEMNIEELCKGANKLNNHYYSGIVKHFGLVIEEGLKEPAFMSEEPIAIIKSGKYHKVPLIMGYCSGEGMLPYAFYVNNNGELLSDKTFIPHSMNSNTGSDRSKLIAKCIKDFYFNGSNPLENKDDIYRLYTDSFTLLGVYNAAKCLVETGNTPLYFYKFSLDSALNLMKKFWSVTGPGACHYDTFFYLFKHESTPKVIEAESAEYIGMQRMIKLWTNFARLGNPTPHAEDELLPVTWKPLEPQKFYYLDIGEHCEMKIDPEKRAMNFWNNLYTETSTMTAKL